jgi:hypothetical protein
MCRVQPAVTLIKYEYLSVLLTKENLLTTIEVTLHGSVLENEISPVLTVPAVDFQYVDKSSLVGAVAP